MRITNNSSFIICVRFGENVIQEIAPKQIYNTEAFSEFEIFLKNNSSIKKKKHSDATITFSIVSKYVCDSTESNSHIEIDVETDSMLFGVEYICALVKKAENVTIKEKNFYIKDSNNIDSLFEERYMHNFKQDLQMDYIHSFFELPSIIIVAVLLKNYDYSILSIIVISLLFALLIFICNRVYTLLIKRKKSKHYKIDKNSFYEKCSAEYITCFYQTKTSNYSKKEKLNF
ncbi:MAG: hypothetical protein IKC01_09745 [Clostridia bacterium]|nr:hypothetical protein [Clostridia bacterium]